MTHTTQSILALLERALQTSAKPEVIERLRWFAHFTEHGSVSKTCNEFSIARTTFYRWYNRLDAKNLSTLENIPKSRLLNESSHSNHNCLLCSLRQKLTHKPTAFFALVAALINISIFFLIALPQVAGAASSWAPTLIVNTEAFQVIDDTDSAADLYLQFGGSLNKRLTYDRTLASFIFDDDLEVIGTISGATIHAQDHLSTSGSLAIESGLYGAGLSDCDNATGDKLLWNADDGTFSCGTDQSGGGGSFSGTGSLQNFFDNRYVEIAGDTMTGALTFSSTDDTEDYLLDVFGSGTAALRLAQFGTTTGATLSRTNANALTLTNMVAKPTGVATYAVNFDGDDDYISATGYDSWTEQTIAVWFNTAGNVDSFPRVIEKGFNNEWTLTFNTNVGSKRVLVVQIANGNVLLSSSANLDDGFWHHAVVTISSTYLTSLYIDGVFDSSAQGSTPSKTGDISIGGYPSQSTTYFTGDIDDVRIWDDVLSTSDISDLYNGGNGTLDSVGSNLVSWWKLDDSTGTTAADSSGNGLDGTLTNGPTWTTGKVSTIASIETATIISSIDGTAPNEQGIVKFGHTLGNTTLQGTELKFNIQSTEKARFSTGGFLGIGTTSPETLLELIGTASGRALHAQDTLTSSGNLVVEGAARLNSTLTIGGVVYTFPDADGSASGKVLATDSAGTLSWTTATDTNQLTTFSLTGDSGSPETIAQGNTLDIAGGASISTVVSATDTLTVDITDDSIDFTEMADALSLDASTTLSFGASNFIYDLTSTGDFMIRDNGAAAFFVGDNGHIGMGTEDLVSGIEFELAATDTLVDMYFKRIDSTISNGTGLGFIRFTGTDGGSESAPLIGAGIQGQAAGTWATGNSPANLIFSTTPDSSSTLTERMRIRPDGSIGIGTTSPDTTLDVVGAISGSTLTISSLQGCDTIDTDTAGNFSCGTDASGGGGFSGTGSLQNFFDNRYVETAGDTMTGTLLIDQNANSISLDIDSEATTADIINISASALTTGKSIDIGDADSATTGTGLIFTGISNSSDTSKRSLFFIKNDHASADSTTVMHLQQDGAATTFLADTDGNGIAIDVDSEATSEPGLRISMPTPNASENPHILFGYENIFDTNLFRDTYNSLTTSGSFAIDPPGLNGAYGFDSVTYTDNLAEARTTGGTAFTIFAAENPSNDLFYVGMDDRFGTIYFDLAVGGAGITFEVEYWNGSAWTVTGYRDTTNNLTQDGTVTFVNPENWAVSAVNGEGVNKYWVRLNPQGDNITTAPTAYSVSPTTDYRFKVFSNAADTQPTLFVANDQKVGIKTSLPDTELEVVGVISGSTLHSTDLLSGSGYAVFRNVIDSTTAFQINDKDGGAPVFNVDTTNERIGIRNASPVSALHIENDVVTIDRLTGQQTFIQLRDNSDSDAGFLYIGGDNTDGAFINAGGTPDKLLLKANGTTKMSIGTAGVNIGTGTPNDALDVEGDIDTTGCFQADDTTTIGGTCLSDARLKENIVPLQGMLGKVELLNPVQFDWKAGAPEHGTTVGLIAQELEQVFPHLVSDHEDGFKKVRYDIEMQMVVLAALKELAANVRSSEIDILSFGSSLGETMGLFASRLTNLEKRVEDIENQLPELGENGDLQTISGGQISIGGTFYLIDTENSDDTDVLAKLDGGTVNQILVLQGFDEEHEITVRKTKSLVLKEDYKIRGPEDVLVLLKVTDSKWIELSRTGK